MASRPDWLAALPVTGGQFRVENIDPQRDEILLARNDRFWGEPAKPDLILLRRGGDAAALADSIRNGDTQVAQVHGGAATFAQLSAIPDVRTARIVAPRVMQLSLRARQPALADSQVRKAIFGLLDVDLLAAVGAGDDNTVTLAQAQVRSPSDPGYVPTAPPAISSEDALGLLVDAGYEVEPVETPSPPIPGTPAPDSDRGQIIKDGVPLSLVLGVAANDPMSIAVANTAADQLRNVGIAASVSALDPVVLYGEALTNNRVDAVVGWRQAGGDLATALASRYGCRALEATAVATTEPGASTPQATPQTTPTSTATTATTATATTATTTTATTSPPQPGELVQAPSNITGICDHQHSAEDRRRTGRQRVHRCRHHRGRTATVEPVHGAAHPAGHDHRCGRAERAERQAFRSRAYRHRRRRRHVGENPPVTPQLTVDFRG